MKRPYFVSVVIPVYNSADSISSMLKRVTREAERYKKYEIILVNDGSRDQSWEQIRKGKKAHPNLKGINLSKNFGQHNALLAGIIRANGDIVVTLDDDLQFPPEEMHGLIEVIGRGRWDVAYGKASKERHGVFRNICSHCVKSLTQYLLGVPYGSSISSFRALNSKMARIVAAHRGSSVFVDELLFSGTAKIRLVPVRHEKRAHGKSNYNILKLISHASNLVFSCSAVPLKILKWLGGGAIGLSCTMGLYVLYSYLVYGVKVPGFAFISLSFLFFSGIQIFFLGVMAEYILRIYYNSFHKAPFIIADEV
jgi:undecaprenyl-phosphate 4-deoxy-4-formamido-L-arabinose transferase